MRKHIAIFVMLALAAAAQDQPSPQRPQPGKPIKIDPAFQKAADETGGQVFAYDPRNPTQAELITLMMARGHDVVTAHGHLSGERQFEAPVPSGVDKLMVSVQGGAGTEVRTPEGRLVGPSDPGVRFAMLSNGGILSIDEPGAGTWNVKLKGNGDFSIHVATVSKRVAPGLENSAATPQQLEGVELVSFEFQEAGGRPGHEGLFKIAGFPLAGQKYPVEAIMNGDYSTLQFEFRSAEGDVLQQFRLKRATDPTAKEYFGEVMVPDKPFRVYATGLDMHGERFQRPMGALISPQSFTISAPSFTEFHAGESTECKIMVKNSGAADDFKLRATDDKHLLQPLSETSVHLDAGETRQITLELKAPADAQYVSDTVVITVTRQADSNASNHAVLRATVFPPAR